MLNTSPWSLIVELPRLQVDISFLLLFFIQITVVVEVSALHLDVNGICVVVCILAIVCLLISQ